MKICTNLGLKLIIASTLLIIFSASYSQINYKSDNHYYSKNLTYWQLSNLPTIFLPDTVIVSQNSSASRQIHEYDLKGNLTTIMIDELNDNKWENLGKLSLSYSSEGNLISLGMYKNIDGQFIEYAKESYTYDTNGNMLISLYEEWHENSWITERRTVHTYDSFGNVLSYVDESWENNNWNPDSKYIFTYNSNGNKLTEIRQNWQNNSWYNSYKRTFTYDEYGNELASSYDSWEDNSWVLSYKQRTTYTFDGSNNILTKVNENWYDNFWRNNLKTLFSYDSNGNKLTEQFQFWNNNSWENKHKFIYSYDSNGNFIKGDFFTWDDAWVYDQTEPFRYYVNGELLYTNDAGHSVKLHWFSLNTELWGDGVINGYVYMDANEEKSATIQLEDYHPVSGAKVFLYKETNVLIDSLTTPSDGFYEFSGIPEGLYYIEIEIEGFTQTSTYNIEVTSDELVFENKNFIVGNNEIVTNSKDFKFNFSIYPNPASEVITVISGDMINSQLSYKVYNDQGLQIKSDYLINRSIDVSYLKDGIYILIIDTPSKQVFKKFIKQ